jgi:hypothetical protein
MDLAMLPILVTYKRYWSVCSKIDGNGIQIMGFPKHKPHELQSLFYFDIVHPITGPKSFKHDFLEDSTFRTASLVTKPQAFLEHVR